jgi:hypothetical protein
LTLKFDPPMSQMVESDKPNSASPQMEWSERQGGQEAHAPNYLKAIFRDEDYR